MARHFVAASTQYLQRDAVIVAAYPFTFGCWWRPSNDTTESEFFYLGDKGESHTWYTLGSRLDNGDFRARLRVSDSSSHEYVWGGILAANTWYHITARITSTNDEDIFTGGSKVDGNTARNPIVGNFDRITIGRLGDSSPSNPSDGDIAEAFVYGDALADVEIASLAAGFSPLFVRPQSLQAYWPLIRDEDQDRVGGYDLTDFGSPTIADHPPVLYPAPLFLGAEIPAGGESYFKTISDSVGATDTLSIILNYYRSLDDTVTISDELSKKLTAKRTIEDAESITDSITTTRSLIKTLVDTVGITDSISATIGIIVAIADTVGITSAISTARDIIINVADSIGITDLLSKIGTFFIRPDGDQAIGQWTDELDGTTNIYQSIDEPAPAIDSDYIQSPFAPQTQSYTCTLSDALDPGVDTGHTLSYRYRKFPVTNQQVDLTVTLLQGAAELTSWDHIDVASGWITANQLVLSGIIANITDYTDLRLEFEADII